MKRTHDVDEVTHQMARKPFSPVEEEPPEPAHIPTTPPPPGATLSKEVKESLAELQAKTEPRTHPAHLVKGGLVGPSMLMPTIGPFTVVHRTFSELKDQFRHSPSDQAASVAEYLNAKALKGHTCVGCWADSTNIYFVFQND